VNGGLAGGSGRANLAKRGRPQFGACPSLEVRGKASQFIGDEGIGGIVGGAPAMLRLALEVLGRCHGWMGVLARLVVGCCCGALLNAAGHGRFLAPSLRARAGTGSRNNGIVLKPEAISTLRIAAERRNALRMQDTSPLCPNCIQPMRLTRRIEADSVYCGQDVFECHACRLALTQPQPQRADRRTGK